MNRIGSSLLQHPWPCDRSDSRFERCALTPIDVGIGNAVPLAHCEKSLMPLARKRSIPAGPFTDRVHQGKARSWFYVGSYPPQPPTTISNSKSICTDAPPLPTSRRALNPALKDGAHRAFWSADFVCPASPLLQTIWRGFALIRSPRAFWRLRILSGHKATTIRRENRKTSHLEIKQSRDTRTLGRSVWWAASRPAVVCRRSDRRRVR